MIPLNMSEHGIPKVILRVGGTPQVKHHLEELGFSCGSEVTLISELNGNVIVKVKEARVAISSEMARRIMV